MSDYSYVLIFAGLLGFSLAALQSLLQYRRSMKTQRMVMDAEERAFLQSPGDGESRILELGRLFDLYSKQITKYQDQTRNRAKWSFVFAISAMVCGFGFVVWGGTVLLRANDAIMLAAGGLISAVGGAVSTFISKTFLDVHRLSLMQLNRYFRQPVINDHILMAQRLADESSDPAKKAEAYAKIIEAVTLLITSSDTGSADGAR